MTTQIRADLIKSMAALARECGVRRIRVGDIELELGPAPVAADVPAQPRTIPIGDEEQAPTEDQLLYWSSGYELPVKAEEPA